MRLPDFVGIGAMKAGTTSLGAYLDLHPDVGVSAPKELDFFVAERNWRLGRDWYAGCFENLSGSLVGEVSPNYTKYPQFEGVVERMVGTVPDARLVYLVRDPVERLVSHYRHNLMRGRVHDRLDEVVRDVPIYVDASRYGMQIRQYLEAFDADQLLVVAAEDLRRDRRTTLARIVTFLGADATRLPADLDFELHSTDDQRHTPPLVRRVLDARAYRVVRRLVPRRLRRSVRDATTWSGADLDAELWRLTEATRRWLDDVFAEDRQLLSELLGHDPLA